MKYYLLSIFLLYLCAGCSYQQNQLEPKSSIQNWSVTSVTKLSEKSGLLNVESILHDAPKSVFYASSGLNYQVGSDGFISKLSHNGEVEKLKWVDGLNRPTGMAINGRLLYVADVNTLLAIDTKTGKIVNRYVEPVVKSGLNDVAVNENGEVYVTASFVHSVFKLEEGNLNLWAKDEKKLSWANGIIATENSLIVAGLHLSRVDMKTKQVEQIVLSPEVKDFDGIVADGESGYFLTTVENSGLFHINAQNNVKQLMKGEAYFGDLTFDKTQNVIYIPRGNKEDGEFYISAVNVGLTDD